MFDATPSSRRTVAPRLFAFVAAALLCGCVNPAVQRQQQQAAAAERQKAQEQREAEQKAIQDGREAYIAANPQLSEEIKYGIHNGRLVIGMTWMDVKATLDELLYRSRRVNRDQNAYGVRDQWVLLDGRYLYFNNGVLESIQSTGGAY